ncbi:helix-turn-helix transcriptional regulator [Photobacterium sp. CAU 1568]|uniref:Helix-turn-helix transcriptional regulator n=1 Tax=Photobacterium arenosum TaxID=2774143 RepID=A0ABR9BI39_9GAMM|nr:helix-turn-helix transcriptional regulator [Photobacterium arenosum]MBD8511370.1 helix-turn-helix transcriptional regulator [Photobacterium arenosum]
MVASILLAGIIQSIVLGVYLAMKSKEQHVFWLLAGIHFCFALDLSLNLAWHQIWLTSRMNMMWPLLYPVLFFLFIRLCLTQRPLTRRDTVHLLPLAALSLLCADLLFAPGETVLTARHHFSGILLIVFYLGYCLASIRFVWRYQSRQPLFQAKLSNANLLVLWGICASLILALVMVIPQVILDTHLPLPYLTVSLLLFVITCCLLIQPKLMNFDVMVELPDEEADSQPDGVMAALSQTVLMLMDEKHYYLKPEISLSSLAGEMGVKPYLLTQVLNQTMGIKFYDLVNQRRITHVCALMEKRPSSAVLELAFESGFNSKSTFNAAFRKYQQCTPSQYRTRLKGAN